MPRTAGVTEPWALIFGFTLGEESLATQVSLSLLHSLRSIPLSFPDGPRVRSERSDVTGVPSTLAA